MMSQHFERIPDTPEAGFTDDEAAREHGRQLAMDLVLHQFYRLEQAPVAEEAIAEKRPTVVWLQWLAPIAAVLVLFGAVQMYLSIEGKKEPSSPAWSVKPQDRAEYAMIEPNRVRLVAGELLVPPSARPITIETEHGSVSATGAEFRIGTELVTVDAPFAPGEGARVTRIRVISGEVTFVTDAGTVVGRANEVLEFEDGKMPKNLGVPGEP